MFLLLDIFFKGFFLYYVSDMRGLNYLFFVGNILFSFSLLQILTVS
jgi:hypothetical protein